MIGRTEHFRNRFRLPKNANPLGGKIPLTWRRARAIGPLLTTPCFLLANYSLSVAAPNGQQAAWWPRIAEALTMSRRLGTGVSERLKSSARPDAPSDTELLQRMAGADQLAFVEFYDRHSTMLFSIAIKVVGDVHEAEEVLQDAARYVWEHAPLYDPALGKPLSWAIVITRNKAIDRLRVLQRIGKAVAKITEEAAADYLTRTHRTPNEAITNETGALLRNALSCLPADQRLAIELAFFTGLSQSEIAVQLDEPLGTIKARIRRGMLIMRQILEEQL
jgi:RNA polymerase sigma-70 factor, ECF subfamily